MSMNDLNNVSPEDRIHFSQCCICNQYFDCRDLTEVVEHFHENISPPEFSSSKRVFDTKEYLGKRFTIDQN